MTSMLRRISRRPSSIWPCMAFSAPRLRIAPASAGVPLRHRHDLLAAPDHVVDGRVRRGPNRRTAEGSPPPRTRRPPSARARRPLEGLIRLRVGAPCPEHVSQEAVRTGEADVVAELLERWDHPSQRGEGVRRSLLGIRELLHQEERDHRVRLQTEILSRARVSGRGGEAHRPARSPRSRSSPVRARVPARAASGRRPPGGRARDRGGSWPPIRHPVRAHVDPRRRGPRPHDRRIFASSRPTGRARCVLRGLLEVIAKISSFSPIRSPDVVSIHRAKREWRSARSSFGVSRYAASWIRRCRNAKASSPTSAELSGAISSRRRRTCRS